MSVFGLTMLLLSSLIHFVGVLILALFGWFKQDEIRKGSWLLRPLLLSILALSSIGLICLAIAFQPIGSILWSVEQ